jgi:hypothetical protein
MRRTRRTASYSNVATDVQRACRAPKAWIASLKLLRRKGSASQRVQAAGNTQGTHKGCRFARTFLSRTMYAQRRSPSRCSRTGTVDEQAENGRGCVKTRLQSVFGSIKTPPDPK